MFVTLFVTNLLTSKLVRLEQPRKALDKSVEKIGPSVADTCILSHP